MTQTTTEPDKVSTADVAWKFSSFWCQIQNSLFPYLEEALGGPVERYAGLIYLMSAVRIERFVPSFSGLPGRPSTHRILARAFLAKAFLNLATTRDLIDLLKIDVRLRRIVGFERADELPHESTFSRAFSRFSQMRLADTVHEQLVKEEFGSEIVHVVARDSTAIEAREKAAKRPPRVKGPKKKRGRKKGVPAAKKEPNRQERQLDAGWRESLMELPTQCDIGVKKNSKGHNQYWVGYKFHVDVTQHGIPLAAVSTSASLHDSQVAIPLMKMTTSRVGGVFYQLMDRGYVGDFIKKAAEAMGQKAIVQPKKYGGTDPEPLDPATAERFKARTLAERFNSELKDNYGGRHVRVRTHPKVHLHLMLGTLCIFALALLRC